MARLPRPTGPEFVRFLERRGFVVLRVKGSHHIMASGNKGVAVPVHGHQQLKIGTLRSMLRKLEIDPDKFEQLWNE